MQSRADSESRARAGATGGKGRWELGAFSPVVNIENPGNREATLALFALTFGHGARPAAVAGGAESTYYKLVVLVALVLVVLTLLLVLLLLLLLLLLLVLVLVPTVLSMMALPSPQKVPPRKGFQSGQWPRYPDLLQHRRRCREVGSCRCYYRRCTFSPRGWQMHCQGCFLAAQAAAAFRLRGCTGYRR